MWIDPDFPKVLGSELYRPTPDFIIPYVVRPVTKYDWTKGPGDTLQLDRFNYWDPETDASLTKEARRRADTEVIGTGSSRTIAKEKVIMTLDEYTGPADPSNPNSPSTFKIGYRQIIAAQRNFWEYGQVGFHNSLGSSNLLQDFRRWNDRLYINEMLASTNVYNPRGITDGDTIDLSASSFEFLGAPTINSDDIDKIVADMSSAPRFTPKFEDGNIGCVCSPRFIQLLKKDPKFREVARYPGALGGQMPMSMMMSPVGDGAPPQIPYGVAQNMMGNAPYQEGIYLNQARNIMGQTNMPTGFVFNGVRFFVSNNLPQAQVTFDYQNPPTGSNLTSGSALRTAELAFFFGPQAVGTAIGGPGPEILLNRNDDFARFLIAVWRTFGDWKLLDERFVTVARSYIS